MDMLVLSTIDISTTEAGATISIYRHSNADIIIDEPLLLYLKYSSQLTVTCFGIHSICFVRDLYF